MNASHDVPFPLEQWSADMQAAVAKICELADRILRTHREASERAAEAADQWKLPERLEDERIALEMLFDNARRILASLESTRQLMHDTDVEPSGLHDSMRLSAETIDAGLPMIEKALLTVRHAALDLLRWTARAGHLEGSGLPAEYRASYAKLIEYAPVFRPRLEAMQQELLRRSHGADPDPNVQVLLSALSRYNGVVQSARAFVGSVVDPPMELVFHDTESFHADWQTYPVAEKGHLATEFNDCCQLLLYDTAEFHRRVNNVRPRLVDGVDASLYVLPIDATRVMFTVDEDPLFKQLIVTLLRVVPEGDFERASNEVIDALYRELSDN